MTQERASTRRCVARTRPLALCGALVSIACLTHLIRRSHTEERRARAGMKLPPKPPPNVSRSSARSTCRRPLRRASPARRQAPRPEVIDVAPRSTWRPLRRRRAWRSMPIRRRGRTTRNCAPPMGLIVAWHRSWPDNSGPRRRGSTGFGSATATACTTSRRPGPVGSARLRPTAPWKRSASEFVRTGPTQNGSCCGCTANGASPRTR